MRAIDKQVVCLINFAEISGRDDSHHTGGGVVLLSPDVTVNPFSEAKITVEIRPAQAVQAGALWRVVRGADDFSPWFNSGAEVVTKDGLGAYPVEFSSIDGFITPAIKHVDVLGANAEYTDSGDYVPTATLSGAGRLLNGSFRFTLYGARGYVYSIQGSTNLAKQTDWATLATLTNYNGTIQVNDPNATNFSLRFYRAKRVD